MKIPESENTIESKIDAHHEALPEAPRPHIGASALGHPCDRWLWLSFRWAVQPNFPGRIRRLFRRGVAEEQTIISDLRAIGIDVRSGGQTKINLGCHVSGSLDAIIESGVPGAPKKRHIAEFKTHRLKSFLDLEKHGVEKSKPEHFIQMQVYMAGAKIDRALYIAVCKDNDKIYTERVAYDKNVADKSIERGQRIALSERMPEPISSDPSWYQCKFCHAHEFCHQTKKTKNVNCRTCAMATPRADSTWHCARWDSVIPLDAQRVGCDSHALHPDIVPWQRLAGPDEYTAIYKIDGVDIANGDQKIDGVYGSAELLSNAAACAGGDKFISEIRKNFDGRIIG